jgi:hypothetical protein
LAEAGLLELDNLEWWEFFTRQDSQIQLALHGTCVRGPNRPPTFKIEFRALIDVSEVIFEGREEMLPEARAEAAVRPLSPHCTANVQFNRGCLNISLSYRFLFSFHFLIWVRLESSSRGLHCFLCGVRRWAGNPHSRLLFTPHIDERYDSSHILHRQWQTPPQNLQKMFKLK